MIYKINISFVFFCIFFLNFTPAKSNLKEKLIEKINQIENISFDFEQEIEGKKETGECVIKYQKLISL